MGDDRTTTDGRPADPAMAGKGAPQPIDPATGQHAAYFILTEEERRKGYVRPVRDSYRHDVCGAITKMGPSIAETYARDPKFYGSTFCIACRKHLPVGEFTWDKSSERLGS